MDSCYRQSQLVYCLTNVTTKYQITFPPIPENIPNSIQPISYIISYLYARFTRFPISYCGPYMVDIKYIYILFRGNATASVDAKRFHCLIYCISWLYGGFNQYYIA